MRLKVLVRVCRRLYKVIINERRLMYSIESIKQKVNMALLKPSVMKTSLLDDKIAELKKDPKYSGWSDDLLEDYASSIIKKANSSAVMLNINYSSEKLGHPLDPEWSQFSYEEILQMEDNGVVIPEEFLEWAHSMQSSNVVEYELDTGDVNDINDSDGLKTDIGEAGYMGKKDVAKVFNKQVQAQEEILAKAAAEFEQYSAKLEVAADDTQTVQNNALKKVQEMMSEWQIIDTKVKNGEELSQDEKARYGQLGLMMNNEVKSSTVQIENFTSDFNEITKLMQAASKEAKVAQDYASDTSYVGQLITEYEVAHNSRMASGNNHIFDGATGVVDLLKSNTIGKNLAVTSIKDGNELQSITFKSDRSIKKVNAQMRSMTVNIASGDERMVETVADGQAAASAVPQSEEKTNPIEPPPSEENSEILDKISKKDEDDNLFTDEEDFNNINSVVKRQQKQVPKIQPQDNIVT